MPQFASHQGIKNKHYREGSHDSKAPMSVFLKSHAELNKISDDASLRLLGYPISENQ